MMIRTALGARRWRFVGQLLLETTLLAFLGGIVGLLIALSSAETIKKLSPPEPYRFQQLTVDWNGLAFVFDVILLASFLAGHWNCIEGGEPFQFVTLISINHRFPAPADFTGWRSFRKKGSIR
jgi:ABC-type antimicrobial peptide transport system permease subunit